VKNRRAEILSSADQIASALRDTAESPPGELPGASVLQTAYQQLAARFDTSYGGFGGAPKFRFHTI